MPYPYVRSPLFWGGLIVAAFIAFGWIDSRRYYSEVDFGEKWMRSSFGRAGIQDSRVWINLSTSSPLWSQRDRFNFQTCRGRLLPEEIAWNKKYDLPWLPGFWFHYDPHRKNSSGRGDLHFLGVSLPFWIPLSATLCTWAALLKWRARRYRKAQNSLPNNSSENPAA